MVLEVEISLLVQLLNEELAGEARSLRGVEDKVEILTAVLKDVIGFTQHHGYLEGGHRFRWISEVREVVGEAEDVVEMFLVNEGSSRRRGMFKTKRDKTGQGREIDSIRDRLGKIISNGRNEVDDRYRMQEPNTDLEEEWWRWRLPYREKVVGMEDEVEKLLRESVLDKQNKGLSIAVVEGMAGIGKTTLARQIYDHRNVICQFPYRGWVMVSSDFTLERTMKLLILQLGDYCARRKLRESELDREKLQEILHKLLQSKTYFIVVDDVREMEHWESLKATFPDEQGLASRLLLTTRNKYIATHDRRYTHHEMKLLHPEKSWELFVMKAGSELIGGYPKQLEPIGREIVKRCEGLPLAISELGVLLSSDRSKKKWEQVPNQISSHLGRAGAFTLLKSSYEELSPHLKTCFLCLAFFKEDATIPAKALLHIWYAQGLIKKYERSRTMEEIAREYLDELTNRNMLQIVDLTMEDRVKNFYLHGVLREVLLEERAKVELRLERVKAAEGMISSEHESRHRVLYGGSLETLSRSGSKCLRSIFLHNNKGEGEGVGVDVDVSSVSPDFWKRSQLLRILYLDGIELSTFPDSLRALVRLKYLMIRRRKIHPKCALEVEDYLEAVKLPNWLDGLKHLEVVDMEGEKVEFPKDVTLKMKRLRYFSAYCVRGPMSINSWENIETLKYMRQEDWMECCSRQSSSCIVRKLGLFLDPLNRADEWREVRASLESLKELEHLQLRWNPLIPVDPEHIVPKLVHTLTKLKLRGTLTKCPDATIFPPNLSHLTLAFSDLSEDLIPQLSKLPKLSYLKLLGNAYKPERMQVLSDGFPCLKVLTLKEMFHLRSIHTQQGGMLCLEKLRIQQCPSLQTMKLPEHVIIKRIP